MHSFYSVGIHEALSGGPVLSVVGSREEGKLGWEAEGVPGSHNPLPSISKFQFSSGCLGLILGKLTMH